MKQLSVLALTLLIGSAVHADDGVWKNHEDPYDFLFGNHIDTHQETRLLTGDSDDDSDSDSDKDSDSDSDSDANPGSLEGFFYVFWTGDVTEEGLPVAAHCTKPEHYAAGCFSAWNIKAEPCIAEVNGCEAMFLYHNDDHPVWLVGPRSDSDGNLRGTRGQIVQPGSYTHMHWLTEGADHDGTFLPSSHSAVEALFAVDIDVPDECNVSRASALTPGTICPGYFLQIEATETFAFKHGGELIPVRPGIDNSTHLNLVTSIPAE